MGLSIQGDLSEDMEDGEDEEVVDHFSDNLSLLQTSPRTKSTKQWMDKNINKSRKVRESSESMDSIMTTAV